MSIEREGNMHSILRKASPSVYKGGSDGQGGMNE